MAVFVSILVNGLELSSLYALLAVGFSIVFGVGRIINMAYTGFYMIAAYFLFIFFNLLKWPFWLSVIFALLLPTLMAIGFYKTVLERIRQHELAVVLATISLALIFQEILLIAFGGYYWGVPPFISGFLEILGVRVMYQNFFVIGVCLLSLCGAFAFLYKTRWGNALRAVSQDMEIANLMGIDVAKVWLITIGISTLMAGIAAVVIAPIYVIEPLMWANPLVIIIAAVILGGLGSIKGSIFGALILGFVEISVISLIPGGSYMRGAFSLLALAIILTVRPEGLFGVSFQEEKL